MLLDIYKELKSNFMIIFQLPASIPIRYSNKIENCCTFSRKTDINEKKSRFF